MYKFFYYSFLFFLSKNRHTINHSLQLSNIYQWSFVSVSTAPINPVFSPYNWYFLRIISGRTDLYTAHYHPANRTPDSQKVVPRNRQPIGNLFTPIGSVSSDHGAQLLVVDLAQLTGKSDTYTQWLPQQANCLPGSPQLNQSIQLTDLLATSQQQLFILTGCAVLLGIGYVVYTRQQRTIRLLTRQKAETVKQVQHLERINQQKVNLFSLISHDLRLPVVRLKQQLNTLKQASPATAPINQQIREAEEQVDQLARMLTNLLDWSVVQMKGLPTNPVQVDVSVLTAEVIADVSTQLKHKNIRLINQVSASTWIIADRYQLLCVVRNLVSNAIKFTPPHGYVRLYTKTAGESCIWLTVRDTGIGMSADEVACVLSAPVIRSGTQGEPGTGLGLLLCRELLGDDADALQLTSQPGKGTSVSVRLVTADKPTP